jgi:hypothetical protein
MPFIMSESHEVPQLREKGSMPTARSLIAALTMALTAVSCSDDKGPTSPDQQNPTAPAAARAKSNLLKNVPVTGTTVYDANLALHPTIPEGTPGPAFSGTVTVTRFDYDEVTGQLLVSGRLTGNGTVKDFSRIPAELTKGAGAPTSPVCPILDLDIGAIHLDLLGLVVDLAPIHLDITAESGSGNLLGNLLCALVGILDGPNVGGLLDTILQILNQINAILAGL